MRKWSIVNSEDVKPIKLSQRMNFKLIDPATVNSKHLTFGMVIVDPKEYASLDTLMRTKRKSSSVLEGKV